MSTIDAILAYALIGGVIVIVGVLRYFRARDMQKVLHKDTFDALVQKQPMHFMQYKKFNEKYAFTAGTIGGFLLWMHQMFSHPSLLLLGISAVILSINALFQFFTYNESLFQRQATPNKRKLDAVYYIIIGMPFVLIPIVALTKNYTWNDDFAYYTVLGVAMLIISIAGFLSNIAYFVWHAFAAKDL